MVRQPLQRLVEQVADVLLPGVVLDVPPAGLLGDVEALAPVEGRRGGHPLGFLPAPALGEPLLDELLADHVELVGGPLQEEHPEDVLLELRGVHLAAEDVGRSEQMPLKLRQRQLRHGGGPSVLMWGTSGSGHRRLIDGCTRLLDNDAASR